MLTLIVSLLKTQFQKLFFFLKGEISIHWTTAAIHVKF